MMAHPLLAPVFSLCVAPPPFAWHLWADDQRRDLMLKIHSDLATLLAAHPDQVVVAGLVLVAEVHRRSLLALAGRERRARLVVLDAPLPVLMERLAARGAHFFNPKAIEALHARFASPPPRFLL